MDLHVGKGGPLIREFRSDGTNNRLRKFIDKSENIKYIQTKT